MSRFLRLRGNFQEFLAFSEKTLAIREFFDDYDQLWVVCI
jgi:hypothetical protein